MSRYVKHLMTEEVRTRLDGVSDALLVNMIGLSANDNNRVRAQLAEKGIQVMVVRNALANRALEGTPLESLFEGRDGTNAICWGAEDIVSLAKEVVKLHGDKQFEAFEARGGVLDGEPLTADEVVSVSKWPSREEQIAILVGQVCGQGGKISGQIGSIGAALASQVKSRAEEGDDGETAE